MIQYDGTFGLHSRQDEVKKLRTDQDQLPGQLAAQTRLVGNGNRVFNAFNSLDLGFDVEAAIDFTKPSAAAIGVPQENLGLLIGWCLSFGIVCVEAERQRQQEEARMQDEEKRSTEHTEETETETHTEKTETSEPTPDTDSNGEGAEGDGDSGDSEGDE